ncbi:hypothetical protein HMPREF3185_01557 [Porphyromonas somerae]|uniref:Uncharacterized protein n=1 Tax=Porphyromonas somerae TaxID=322095 RepID=A0A134B4N3_9PORP|nr:hypothetical protein HMPREF3184_01557 [Porphyromonadaceae bacterium KA00676]KXB74908.1 hypothetical protein HMPREF3185_01557 [Porphyromonas somerae]
MPPQVCRSAYLGESVFARLPMEGLLWRVAKGVHASYADA